jgi:trigger factor
MAKDEKNDQQKKEKKSDLKVNLQDTGPCKKKVEIEVPEKKIKEKLDQQFRQIAKDTVIPGFRKGRAPMRLVIKRYGENVNEQVKLQILAESSEDALKQIDIKPLSDPDIDYKNIELPDSGPLRYDFEVEVTPEFELPELEGIEIEKPKIEISDQQIDDAVQEMRKRAGIWTPKDGPVEKGDQVVADASVTEQDGPEVQKEDNIEIFARERGFVGPIPVQDLDKLLEGAKSGDEKSKKVEVPETFYNEEYRGKTYDVQIKIKEVKSLEPAELNEEFFQRFGVNDENELRESIEDMRHQHMEREAKTAMSGQIYEYLLEETDFDLPADVVADQSMKIMQRQYTNMLMQGTPKEQIQEQMEQLRASSQEQAVEQLKLFFIMNKIADKFEINVTEEEINGYIAQAAAQKGKRPEKMREELAKDGSLEQFYMQAREQKCIQKILEDAEIKEVEPEKIGKSKKKKTAKKKKKKESEKADNKEKADKKESQNKKTAKKSEKKEKKAKKTKSEESKKAPDSTKAQRKKTAKKRKKKKSE